MPFRNDFALLNAARQELVSEPMRVKVWQQSVAENDHSLRVDDTPDFDQSFPT